MFDIVTPRVNAVLLEEFGWAKLSRTSPRSRPRRSRRRRSTG